ncbi:MAG: 1-acyl-sn-glycerol-3-phosphate acyltransferase [Pseudomonadota bacterium]
MSERMISAAAKLASGITVSGELPRRPGRAQLYLLCYKTDAEKNLLATWFEGIAETERKDHPVEAAWIKDNGSESAFTYEGLIEGLAAHDSLDFIPVGIAWKPVHDGRQTWREIWGWMRLIDSNRLQKKALKQTPERVAMVIGEFGTKKALVSKYKLQWSSAGLTYDESDEAAFADYIALQAFVTIQRDSRQATNRVAKYPRHVTQSIWGRPDFNAELIRLAETEGRTIDEVKKEAQTCMDELIPKVQAPHVAMSRVLMKFISQLGYESDFVYDEERMAEVRNLSLQHPTAFVWTHKTHVDGAALMAAAQEENFPLVHMIGGSNMAFLGIGYLMRRAGGVFIRRKIESQVYKIVMRYYFAFLLQKRFPVSWALEGTRSRNGKLMPPRFGILKYVIEAARKENLKDVQIVPISIYYDLIAELEDYAHEQSGGTKRKESLAWFAEYLRGLQKPLGRISFGLGEPVVVDATEDAFATASEGDGDTLSIELQKLAFQASVSVNQVTPVIPTALIAMILTGAHPRALTREELTEQVVLHRNWAIGRGVNLAPEVTDLDEDRFVELTNAMAELGVVHIFDEGRDTLYCIHENKHYEASYYRNTAIHMYVEKAIAELALAMTGDASGPQAVEDFRAYAARIKDIFKFEFFYPESDAFNEKIADELAYFDPAWEARLSNGGAASVLASMKPHVAHAVLRPFSEAYYVVAGLAEEHGDEPLPEKAELVEEALKIGRQAYMQKRITSLESIGKLMFSNGYDLLDNLGLTRSVIKGLGMRRSAFIDELKHIAYSLKTIQDLSEERNFRVNKEQTTTPKLKIVGED